MRFLHGLTTINVETITTRLGEHLYLTARGHGVHGAQEVVAGGPDSAAPIVSDVVGAIPSEPADEEPEDLFAVLLVEALEGRRHPVAITAQERPQHPDAEHVALLELRDLEGRATDCADAARRARRRRSTARPGS